MSVIIPLAVAALFGVNLRSLGFDVAPLKFLPPIYASINGLTAVLLIAAVIAIKKGNKKLHEQLNTAAIACSLLFLLMYIAYHMTSDSTSYGGAAVGSQTGESGFTLVIPVLLQLKNPLGEQELRHRSHFGQGERFCDFC